MNPVEIKSSIEKYLEMKILCPYVISVDGGDEYRKIKKISD